MIPIISLVTSVKDYIEVVHKLIESDSNYAITDYNELGSIITYALISLKNSFVDFFSLNWFKTIRNIPVLVPEISSAMISEISVLDGYFHNTFQFLDTPLSYGPKNSAIYGLEKFVIGLINSCFFIIPTSTAHVITLRRFVMQGLEAGYIAGVGTIAGNIFWIGSIVLGCRFFVIPWLSLDIFRYLLGFMLLIKYMWDSYNEKRMVLEDLSKQKIFLINFLLALTEQTSLYPFLSNLSIGPESSILESFPAETYPQFLWIHICYLLGLVIGSFSLLYLTCWFWENPAFKLYMWVISSFKVSTSFYSKFLNFGFLYLTMICAITSLPYYGLDYTLTKPLGFVSDDRIVDGKLLPETAFIKEKASDKNTRRNRGRHGRRERWKRRVRKYRTFDASLYDQGVYDLFTIEDLNYGFDRFWLRRKIRNHRVRFRFFPGPWMRSFKKQLSKPRLESYAGPRQEFFRILFEQVYHPSFHKYYKANTPKELPTFTRFSGEKTSMNHQFNLMPNIPLLNSSILNYPPTGAAYKEDSQLGLRLRERNGNNASLPILNLPKGHSSVYSSSNRQVVDGPIDKDASLPGVKPTFSKKNIGVFSIKKNLRKENSTLRKFVRKVNNRIKIYEINQGLNTTKLSRSGSLYSKRWKEMFSKILYNRSATQNAHLNGFLTNFYTHSLSVKPTSSSQKLGIRSNNQSLAQFPEMEKSNLNEVRLRSKKETSRILDGMVNLDHASYAKTSLTSSLLQSKRHNKNDNLVLLHPLNYYLKKEKAFQAKLNYYTPAVFRQFSIENNAPYFRVMMKRYFYYYKPTLRWKKTMKVASLRKARRKSSRVPRKLQFAYNNSLNSNNLNAQQLSNSNLKNEDRDPGLTFTTGRDSIPVARERLVLPTSTYTVVGKRASRYRYQIYKDVLQHWYYSPFNRFLLKLDVDSFIRRQPNSHFLTKDEENLIHLRRFLLSEHYNTLRWYTYMQHYRSMKTRIGGTKSFSSTAYNQQFQGTFKKIRHLFAITPSDLSTGESSSAKTVLKFDQPLYNESFNTSNKKYLNTFLIHEELLNSNQSSSLNDLVGQSTGIVRQYLIKAAPIRQQIINSLIEERNFAELSEFLYKGQKTRGTKAVTNNRDLYSQEKNYLLTANERSLKNQDLVNRSDFVQKDELRKYEKEQLTQFLLPVKTNTSGQIYTHLLKKWKRRLNDQEFMKNYLSRRVEKREKREKKKETLLFKKVFTLINWLNGPSSSSVASREKTAVSSFDTEKRNSLESYLSQRNKESLTLPSGTTKAINEGLYSLFNLNSSSGNSSLNAQEKAIWKKSMVLKSSTKFLEDRRSDGPMVNNSIPVNSPVVSKKINLENLRFYENLRKEKEILTSLNSIKKILDSSASKNKLFKNKTKALKSLLAKTINLKNTLKKKFENYLGLRKIYSLVLPVKRKSVQSWRKKERALNKQKKSRKEFKNLSAIITKKKAKLFKNDYYFNTNRNSLIEPSLESSGLFFDSSKNRKQIYKNSNLLEQSLLRKKRDFSSSLDNNKQKEDRRLLSPLGLVVEKLQRNVQSSLNSNFFTKNFKRKKSPQRRARIRRNRGVTRKRTLADSLKREFRNLRRYGEKVDNDSKKRSILERINNYSFIGKEEQTNQSSPSSQGNKAYFSNATPPIVFRRSKQRKQRSWKQKRAKFSQKLRKYKKRRRNVLGKIRILSKQLKRVQSKVQIQNWWWKNFLPSLRANSDALWQIEKDRQIREKLQNMSISEILKRDSINLNSIGSELQIGDKDFKPLALPQAMRLNLRINKKENIKDLDVNILNEGNLPVEKSALSLSNNSFKEENRDFLLKLYKKLLLSNKELTEQSELLIGANTSIPFYAGWDESLRKFVVTNRLLSRREAGFQLSPVPSNQELSISGLNPLFSALSNQNYEHSRQNLDLETKSDFANGEKPALSASKTMTTSNVNRPEQLLFTAAPLKGMNAATTLYWQIPFTTYDPDQFFALGMDGFAPIGWKRFNFRHTILKSWLYYLSSIPYQKSKALDTFNVSTIQNESSPLGLANSKLAASVVNKGLLVKKETTLSAVSLTTPWIKGRGEENNLDPLIYKLNRKNSLLSNLQSKFRNAKPTLLDVAGQKTSKNISRRLKKRNRRVKKHPRAPVWFPSGPLLNQVLPVHYIYVFYKRSRLPQDRYIKRRLQNARLNKASQGVKSLAKPLGEGQTVNNIDSINGPLSPAFVDYTLRKRVKTKRKYHRKKDISKKLPIFPRRVKFIGENMDSIYWRPKSRQKLNKPIGELVREQRLLRNKQRKKENNKNNKQPSLRVKQLRRRVQRQIIRTVWRYKPRAGGFVWPGDYLRLELVKAPKLQLSPAGGVDKSLVLASTFPVDQGKGEIKKEKRKTSLKGRKKKRVLQEWQIQPKKYLLKKHNLRVLKKKLEKANRSSKIKQHIKELNYII